MICWQYMLSFNDQTACSFMENYKPSSDDNFSMNKYSSRHLISKGSYLYIHACDLINSKAAFRSRAKTTCSQQTKKKIKVHSIDSLCPISVLSYSMHKQHHCLLPLLLLSGHHWYLRIYIKYEKMMLQECSAYSIQLWSPDTINYSWAIIIRHLSITVRQVSMCSLEISLKFSLSTVR